MQQRLLDMQLRQLGLLTDTVIWHSRTNLSTTSCILLKSIFPNIRLHYTVKISDRQNSVQIQDTAMHSCILPNFPVELIHYKSIGSNARRRRPTIAMRDDFTTLVLRKNINQEMQACIPWYFLLFYKF